MNSIAFQLGPFTIYWYSIFILIGFLSGYLLLLKEFKKQKFLINFLNDYFFYLFLVAIAGARIYYILFEWSSYKENLDQIFAIWNGGLAIHGGIIAGLLFTIFYTRKHKVDTLKMMDICAPCLILGQAIGRWGNFFNQEAFGPAVDVNTLKNLYIPNFIIEGMKIDGLYHHPTFYYEFLVCIVGFIIIMLIRTMKKTKVGEQTAIYFMVYGVARFAIESLRQDSLMLGNMKMAQLISIVMLLVGFVLFIKQKFYSKQLYNKES